MRQLTESEKAPLFELDTPVGRVRVIFPGNNRVTVSGCRGRINVNRVQLSVDMELMLNDDGSIPDYNPDILFGSVKKENPKDWSDTFNVSRVTRNKTLSSIIPVVIEFVRANPLHVRDGEICLLRRNAAYQADEVSKKREEMEKAQRVLSATLAELHRLEGHA